MLDAIGALHHDPFDRLGLFATCHCDALDTPVLF